MMPVVFLHEGVGRAQRQRLNRRELAGTACASVAAEAGDGFFGGIEQVALVGRKARQIGRSSDHRCRKRAAGAAGEVQRPMRTTPGLRSGPDECQTLAADGGNTGRSCL